MLKNIYNLYLSEKIIIQKNLRFYYFINFIIIIHNFYLCETKF
jgi:hypothetical protein